jgi:hypothetical protein
MKYCLISNGVVINVVLWDGNENIDFGDVEVVGVKDDAYVGPGFTYDGKTFTAPVIPK